MKFDLCQKNGAKELLLSENRLVWPRPNEPSIALRYRVNQIEIDILPHFKYINSKFQR